MALLNEKLPILLRNRCDLSSLKKWAFSKESLNNVNRREQWILTSLVNFLFFLCLIGVVTIFGLVKLIYGIHAVCWSQAKVKDEGLRQRICTILSETKMRSGTEINKI